MLGRRLARRPSIAGCESRTECAPAFRVAIDCTLRLRVRARVHVSCALRYRTRFAVAVKYTPVRGTARRGETIVRCVRCEERLCRLSQDR